MGIGWERAVWAVKRRPMRNARAVRAAEHDEHRTGGIEVKRDVVPPFASLYSGASSIVPSRGATARARGPRRGTCNPSRARCCAGSRRNTRRRRVARDLAVDLGQARILGRSREIGCGFHGRKHLLERDPSMTARARAVRGDRFAIALPQISSQVCTSRVARRVVLQAGRARRLARR